MLDLAPFKSRCEAWGGRLSVINMYMFKRMFRPWASNPSSSQDVLPWGNAERDNSPFDEAPASDYHGVNYHTKTVYVVSKHATVNGLIHEMAHVFACLDIPDKADEGSFLAWEVFTALEMGVYREWSRDNTNYGTGYIGPGANDDEWGDLNAKYRAQFIRTCIDYGLKVGNLKFSYKPNHDGLTAQRILMPVAIR